MIVFHFILVFFCISMMVNPFFNMIRFIAATGEEPPPQIVFQVLIQATCFFLLLGLIEPAGRFTLP